MNDLHRIHRDLKFLKAYAALATIALAALALMGAKGAREPATFSTIRAERIEIVDAADKTRILLTGPQHMPGPGGPNDRRPNARNFVSAGVLFYDDTEHEYGGIMPRVGLDGKSMSAIVFDYSKTEAGAFYTEQKSDGSGFASLIINDPAPPEMPHEEAIQKSWNRIRISNPDRNAEIVLSDSKGQGRIQLRVDNEDKAYFEILDARGKVVFRAPEGAPASSQ